MSSILRGNDNLDSSNLATDTELSIALAGKANTIVANDSQIKTALNATGTAPIYPCRAWVNFNGTGTVAIRASGNVSSITDNGVGDYTVNFTTAMPDENYSMSTTGQPATDNIALHFEQYNTIRTAAYVRVRTAIQAGSSGAGQDFPQVNVSIFR